MDRSPHRGLALALIAAQEYTNQAHNSTSSADLKNQNDTLCSNLPGWLPSADLGVTAHAGLCEARLVTTHYSMPLWYGVGCMPCRMPMHNLKICNSKKTLIHTTLHAATC
jgi:hypothetical protein